MAIAVFATKFALTELSLPGASLSRKTNFTVLNDAISYCANQVRASWRLLKLSKFACFLDALKRYKSGCVHILKKGEKRIFFVWFGVVTIKNDSKVGKKLSLDFSCSLEGLVETNLLEISHLQKPIAFCDIIMKKNNNNTHLRKKIACKMTRSL